MNKRAITTSLSFLLILSFVVSCAQPTTPPVVYTVTFDSQGATTVANPASITVTAPALTISPLPSPLKTGYSFDGWWTQPLGAGSQFKTTTVVSGNMTLYAKWTVINLSVTFDTQGGSAVAGVNPAFGSIITQPVDPTRTGYTFGGWYKEASGLTAWNFTSDTVLTATTLYAKWTVNNYAVSFDSQGGSEVAGVSPSFGSLIIKPSNPTRTGFTFGGWYKEAPCLTTWNFSSDTLLATTTLYAKWIVNNYAVTFDSQGGSAITGSSPAFGSLITKPADPTRTGYTFGGWYKEASCLTAWNFTSDTLLATTTLYAKWIVNNYAVIFNSQGGSAVAGVSPAFGSLITKPADPTRTGYTFGGWYKEAPCLTTWNFSSDALLTATTLFAKWTVNNYAVTFDSQGGSTVNGVSPSFGSLITKPADPTRTGYTFGGWYKEAPCLTAWNFTSDTLLTTTTLYAKWVINNYVLTFDSQGGSAVTGSSLSYGSLITKPADPTRTGYTFGGWYKEASCLNAWEFTSDTVTANATLYIKWIGITHVVTFDSQGAEVVSNPTSINVTFPNVTLNSLPNIPTRDGYAFKGWWSESNGAGIKFTTSTVVSADITVFAHWLISTPGLSFSWNGSGYSVHKGTANTNGTVIIPEFWNGEKVNALSAQAFFSCSGLTSLSIPVGVTAIGWQAFYGCSGLTNIAIPTGVTFIEYQVFWNCTGLTNLTIPTGVTSIGDSAFYGCTSLTSLTIPTGVTSIGTSAFSNCTSLTSLTIPTGVTSIGTSTFSNCTNLTTLTIPTEVTSIGDSAFSGCTSLTSLTIPTGVTAIGNGTFFDCSGLTNLTLPAGVTSIGDSAFYGCTGLTSLIIPLGVTYIGAGVFSDCTGLTSITIPTGVSSIGRSAFFRCTGLTSLIIPLGVTSIGENAFSGCTGLTSISIPAGVTSIGWQAFFGCTGLTSIIIPGGVTTIEDGLFSECSGLTSLTIPGGVTSIGSGAFYGCTVLTNLTIPSGVTSIGVNAFSYCRELTSITIPAGVTSIGIQSFVGCNGLTSLTIPAGLTSIGDSAFTSCNGLTNLIIPTGVTTIGDRAFYDCVGLISVLVNPTVPPTLGTDVFFNTTTSIKVPAGSVDAYKAAPVWSTYAARIVSQ